MIFLIAFLARGIPDLDNLPAPGAEEPTIIIKARTGATIVQTGPVHGEWIAYEAIPPMMIKALTASEDKNFFTHKGLDSNGLIRAVYTNLLSGRVRAGGSTLTQQLAKNLFLTEARTITRKAQELLLTFWLEQQFTKEQIITLYLNRVYFGGGTYGIDAAARKFFGHASTELTPQEAAILAGLVKAPSRLAPHINPDGAWERAKLVIGRMQAEGMITAAAASHLSKSPPTMIRGGGDAHARYFADWVTSKARNLVDMRGQSVIIRTTLDPASQQLAHQSMNNFLSQYGTQNGVSQGSLISLDNDGAVRAMVGGHHYFKSQYNRTTQAQRQPGSAFKLFVYLAALEAGLSPEDIYSDQELDIEGYKPTNYNDKFMGDMTLKHAFVTSTNTVAVQIAEKIGRERVVAMAQRLGINTPMMPIASLPLGTEEVRMIDLAAAYASVAGGGMQVKPYSILEINSLSGEILYRHIITDPVPVLTYPVAGEMSRMLYAAVDYGTGKRAKIDRPAGGKTGTSQDSRDAVFAGFTSEMTTVVWVGNDDGTPMQSVTGGGLPARIWADYSIMAHSGLTVRPLLADAALKEAEQATAAQQERNRKRAKKRRLMHKR